TVMMPRSEEEMAHLTALVREAVGFDESRGDRVNVVNAPFRTIESADDTAITARPLWEEPWIQELARQALAGVGLLLVILLVLRPAVKPLIKPQLPHAPAALGPPALAVVGDDEEEAQDEGKEPETLEGRLEKARLLTREDPRLVAQVVRRWMQDDEK